MNQSQRILESQSNPMTASVHWEPNDDTYEDNIVWFEEFFRLAYEIRAGLGNREIAGAIKELAGKYNITDYCKIGEMSRVIRDVFVKKIREDEIKRRLMEKLEFNDYDSDHILIDLKHVIQLVQTVGAEEVERTTDFLQTEEALKKYPQLANMEIGNVSLNDESNDEFVEPTIRNWLEDYFSHVGTGRHDSLARSEYLFNSKNAKKLDSTDREKLAIILKSYDTGEPLLIDRETKEILFSNMGSADIVSLPKHSERITLPEGTLQIEASGRDDDFRKKWNGQSSLGDKVEEFFSNQEQESLPPDVKSMTFEPGLKVVKPKASSWDRQKEELIRQKEKFRTRPQVANPAPIQKREELKKKEVVRLEEKPTKRPQGNVVDLNEYIE